MKALKIIKHTVIWFFILVFFALLARAWVLRPLVDLEALAPGVDFKWPTHIAIHPENPNIFFVTEKTGRLLWVEKGSHLLGGTVLDLSSVTSYEGWEDGLLFVVFDPDFKSNHYIYIYRTMAPPLRNRVSRFTMNEDLTADPESELTILEIEQIGTGHNGGQMVFDKDGMLFISIGEGGAYGKMQDEAMKLLNGSTLLGTIIRIDVRNATKETPYQIPADNPFVGNDRGLREEIYALGFRNPWRFSIHLPTGTIVAADVGHNTREEIDIVEKGKNYGYPILEGELCHPPPRPSCNREGLVIPTVGFNKSLMRSIIGGYIYRGDLLPWLKDKYVFADHMRGLFSLKLGETDPIIQSPLSSDLDVLLYKMPTIAGRNRGKTTMISSFQEGPDNELYVTDLRGGIYKLVPRTPWHKITGFLYQIISFK